MINRIIHSELCYKTYACGCAMGIFGCFLAILFTGAAYVYENIKAILYLRGPDVWYFRIVVP